MPTKFTIVHISDEQSGKAKAAKVLFPDLANGKYRIEAHNAKQRSNQQNRFYWGVVVPMVRDGFNEKGTELSLEETHEFLKYKFNSTEFVNHDTGECLPVPISTTKLMTTGFMEYVEKIQRFAAEWFGIVIPDPGEILTLNFQEQ